MTDSTWTLNGQYFETCNCDYLCPCITSSLAKSTHGDCTFAMAFHIDRGSFGATKVDGLNFAVIGHTPETMDKGNWSVGLIVDERATPEQQQAIVAMASGQAGGPMAGLAPLIGNFLGVEAKPIRFSGDAHSWSVSIPDHLDEAVEGTTGLGGQQMFLDNTGHPANDRLGLAKATRSHLNAFGLVWDDVSGQNNGHFAPFSWQGG